MVNSNMELPSDHFCESYRLMYSLRSLSRIYNVCLGYLTSGCAYAVLSCGVIVMSDVSEPASKAQNFGVYY